ncbi:hypothetical protein GQ607_003501 [Colletotrichum asianum]|uniref:Secreted protein n=1 Tax=Colletotrichum asianum TaxID=702518 RepID=A0A8H3WRA6_9PEZI|nr:hypothetical protein GQ607_003501 [Colletotrichum asianum]
MVFCGCLQRLVWSSLAWIECLSVSLSLSLFLDTHVHQVSSPSPQSPWRRSLVLVPPPCSVQCLSPDWLLIGSRLSLGALSGLHLSLITDTRTLQPQLIPLCLPNETCMERLARPYRNRHAVPVCLPDAPCLVNCFAASVYTTTT